MRSRTDKEAVSGGCRAPRGGAVLSLLGLFLAAVSAMAQGRSGQIQFSNGEALEGEISLPPRAQLKLHDGNELKVLDLDRVCEIRFAPEKESMETRWRFVEAGRTEKQYFGDPYPVRTIRATASLADETTVSGHLYTTPLYVVGKEKTRKVVLLAKQRGKEGETFEDLTFPVRLAFTNDARPTANAARINVAFPEGTGRGELVALTHGALVRLVARQTAAPGAFLLPSSFGEPVFLAARQADTLFVGWRERSDDALHARLTRALDDAKDFFDVRELLGVAHDKDARLYYTLILLSREGRTTLAATKTQPWRLGIWRWKEAEDGRLMIAGRGYFFRGIVARGAALPAVRLSAAIPGGIIEDGAQFDLSNP